MKRYSKHLRGIVLTWTVLTTTFFWTSTMRVLFKPEISSWSIFYFKGKGFEGAFWILPLVVILALFMFYLEGRGRLRPLFHVLLLAWHSLITGVIIYGSLQPGGEISFGTWGLSVSFIWLVVPFLIFFLLAIALVIQENKTALEIPAFQWSVINTTPLIIALALTVLAVLFFRLGTGFNYLVKIAVGITIVQWILLTEAVGRPYNSAIQKND